jgi:hypothetical protein
MHYHFNSFKNHCVGTASKSHAATKDSFRSNTSAILSHFNFKLPEKTPEVHVTPCTSPTFTDFRLFQFQTAFLPPWQRPWRHEALRRLRTNPTADQKDAFERADQPSPPEPVTLTGLGRHAPRHQYSRLVTMPGCGTG